MANTSKFQSLKGTDAVGGDQRITKLATKSSLPYYQWNLPPHKTSLPVDPSADPLIVDTTKYDILNNTLRDPNSSHTLRRGRIYWYSRVDSEYTSSTTRNTGDDPRYGFQFLWNPSEVNTSVSVNLDITPTALDKFVKVVGAFPSGEYLSLNIMVDRTNDFFAIKSVSDTQSYKDIARKVVEDYHTGYLEAGFNSYASAKVEQLQQFGTLADIEYLYKAINGPGWKNEATDRNSSDIGFLSPTLLKIELGPLGYIGYVQNINVSHSSFTRSMIPIRSTVSLQFNLMATAGLASGGK